MAVQCDKKDKCPEREDCYCAESHKYDQKICGLTCLVIKQAKCVLVQMEAPSDG